MGIISGGGGGGGGPAAGKYLPSGDQSGATLDTTTYTDPKTGNPLGVIVLPVTEAALGIAQSGDSFPRWLFYSDPHNEGLYLGDGTVNARNSGAEIYLAASMQLKLSSPAGTALGVDNPVNASAAAASSNLPRLDQVSPLFSITSGALPTLTIASGTGRQISTTGDVETVTPFTGDGTNNAATCLVQLSPDNVTYSTLDTLSIAAAVNLSGVLALSVTLRVPAAWYVKLTATHGTIGTTTYY